MRSHLHTFVLIGLAAGLVVTGCGDSDPANPDLNDEGTTESIAGTWGGEVDQSGFTYDAVMTIEEVEAGQPAGTIVYAFTNSTCEGDLTFNGTDGGLFIFTEENTTGGCSSPGIIEVGLRNDGTLSWAWFYPDDTSPSATATLAKI